MPTPVEQWVEECAQRTHPKKIHWCDGSEAEYQSMIHDMLETGTLIELNQKEYPGCYLHRSDPTDVARTEHLTPKVSSSGGGCFSCGTVGEQRAVVQNLNTSLSPLGGRWLRSSTLCIVYLGGSADSTKLISLLHNGDEAMN